MCPMPKLSKEEAAKMMAGNQGGGGKPQAVLPEGLYCFALSDHEEKFSREATQAMLTLSLQPCTKDKQKKTAVAELEHKFYCMLPYFADETKFRASVAGKAAAAAGVEAGSLQDVDIDAAITERFQRDAKKMRRTICSIFGGDEFPSAPMWDREAEQHIDSKGVAYTREEANAAWESRNAAIYEACADVVNEDKDVRGYVVYGRVVADTYKGKPTSKIVALYETLPEGESLVSTKLWAAE